MKRPQPPAPRGRPAPAPKPPAPESRDDGAVLVRGISAEQLARIQALAEREHRSRTGQILVLLDEALQARADPHARRDRTGE